MIIIGICLILFSPVHISFFHVLQLLTGLFVEEWNSLIMLTEVTIPRLEFDILKRHVVMNFENIIAASLEAYMSLGGTLILKCRE